MNEFPIGWEVIPKSGGHYVIFSPNRRERFTSKRSARAFLLECTSSLAPTTSASRSRSSSRSSLPAKTTKKKTPTKKTTTTKKKAIAKSSRWPTLLYIPNLIGYVRLYLLYAYFANGSKDLLQLLTSLFLDFFDGAAARYFNQTSRFGCLLDVFIDILTRFLLYQTPFDSSGDLKILTVFSAVEVVCAYCTNFVNQKYWRDPESWTSFSRYSKAVMSNNFRTKQGVIFIGVGLFGLPLIAHTDGTGLMGYLAITMFCRLLTLVTELEVIYRFLLKK